MDAGRAGGRAGRALWAGDEPLPGYRLVSRLGRGGFGEVWKAEAPGGFAVALKFVDLVDDADTPELRSIDIVRNIRHAHLLTLFGSWRIDDRLILGMELADQTLADRLREVQAEGLAGLPEDELLRYMEQAAEGLDYLNGRRHFLEAGKPAVGVQHRDVKPQNLLLVGRSLKVSDFGLARVLERSLSGHTGKGWSVAYAPPEFLSHKTSDRSDQYSLAITYCQLRGGRLPFAGNPAQVMAGHALHPPDLSMIDPREHPAVSRALAKDPQARWADCRSFVDAVRRSREVPAVVRPPRDRPAEPKKPEIPSPGLGTSGRTPRPRPASESGPRSWSAARTLRALPLAAILIAVAWCVVDILSVPTVPTYGGVAERTGPSRSKTSAPVDAPPRTNEAETTSPARPPSTEFPSLTEPAPAPSKPLIPDPPRAEHVAPAISPPPRPIEPLFLSPKSARSDDLLRRAADAAATDLERRNSIARHLAARRDRDLDQSTTKVESLRVERDDLQNRNLSYSAADAMAMWHFARAMLPYKADDGAWRRPVVVECREGEARLFRFTDKYAGYNGLPAWTSERATRPVAEFAQLAQEIQERLAVVARQPTPDGGPCSPFLLLCVNPKGIRSYYELRRALEPLKIPLKVDLMLFEFGISDAPKLEDLSEWSVDQSLSYLNAPLAAYKPRPRSVSVRRPRNSGASHTDASGIWRAAAAALAARLDRTSPIGPPSLRNWLAPRTAELQSERDALRSKFDEWRARDWASVVSPYVLESRRPPLDGKEIHFELTGGNITFIYTDRLLELVKADAKARIRAEGAGRPIGGEVGPVGAFSMRYTLQFDPDGASGSTYGLAGWEIVPGGPRRGEDMRKILNGPSELGQVLKTIGSDRTLITIWVYPDSFFEFNQIRKWLDAGGYQVAARPLPEGLAIQASPNGSDTVVR